MANEFPLMSNQIYQSRELIRNQISEYFKSYMDLKDIELPKSSFPSFIINILSSLTSNLFFYSSSTYREFFLTTAQLPESVYNLSSFLGYSPKLATNSTANLLMSIPLLFENTDTTITIPNNTEFLAQNIPFATYYETNIIINNNIATSIKISLDDKIYDIPFNNDIVNNILTFILPVKQYRQTSQEFQVDSNLNPYQFYIQDVSLTYGQISSIEVQVKDPDLGSWTTFTSFDSLFLMSGSDYGFVYRKIDNGIRLYFGNGLIGTQIKPESTIRVILTETLGSQGNVIPGTIISGNRIYVNVNGQSEILDYSITNPLSATNGSDEETIDEIRINAINSLTMLNRLVTENDYKNVKSIDEILPIFKESFPVLKRSDLKINEIQLFILFNYLNTILPTRNLYSTFPLGTTVIPRNTIITYNNIEYYTIFDLILKSSLEYDSTNPIFYYINYLVNNLLNYQTSSYFYPNTHNLETYINGQLVSHTSDYIESSDGNSITFNSNILESSDLIEIKSSLNIDNYEYIYEYDTTSINNYEIFVPETDINFTTTPDIKVFLNGQLIIPFDGTMGDYIIHESTNSIILKNLVIEPYDSIKIRGTTNKYLSFSKIIVTNDMENNKLIDVPEYYIGKNTIDIYLNGQLLNKIKKISGDSTNILGDYFEISSTEILFTDNVIKEDDLIIIYSYDPPEYNSLIYNDFAEYYYISPSIRLYPELLTTYNDININIEYMDVVKTDSSVTFTIKYHSSETDLSIFKSSLIIEQSNINVSLANDSTSTFSYTFPSYSTIPDDHINLIIRIGTSTDLITDYSTSFIFRSKLSMLSNMTTNSDGIIIYDIPCILKSYYDNMNITDYENSVMQNVVKEMQFEKYRMLTDFTNLKVANTYQTLIGMTYNKSTKTDVLEILTKPKLISLLSPGDRFIVDFCATGNILPYRNHIIEWTEQKRFAIQEPSINDIIYVENLDSKFIFTGSKWIEPIYNLPLQLQLEVTKDKTYTFNDSTLISEIKNKLISDFTSLFGINKSIYKTDILKSVSEIDGVINCSIIRPESDIFFNFDYNEFSQDELLKYGPDYIYFDIDSIFIKIIQ